MGRADLVSGRPGRPNPIDKAQSLLRFRKLVRMLQAQETWIEQTFVIH